MSNSEVEANVARRNVDDLLATGRFVEARNTLVRLWEDAPTAATAAFVVSRFESLREHVSLLPYRVCILRSFTIEPVVPLLRAAAYIGGIALDVQVGDFNVFEQEILDPQSATHRFAPQLVIIAAQSRDVTPALYTHFADQTSTSVDAEVAAASARMLGWIRGLRERSSASVLIHTLESPDVPALGLLDDRESRSQGRAFARLRDILEEEVHRDGALHVLDVDGLIAQHGRQSWRDERKWATARMPLASGSMVHLAREWLRFIHPLAGKVAKVVVCDLDNTLWGGVVGEDGVHGIHLGADYPGLAFTELQRALLDISKRGILLAICSKNNLDDAKEVFDRRSEMLLKWEHFAAKRINWEDKAQGLREIAKELNLGLDSFVFVDDNAVERQWVRAQLPDVTVLPLAENPFTYAKSLRGCPLLERLRLSDEDRERHRFYAEQTLRAELQSATGSLEDFYRSLDQEVAIDRVTTETLPRAAQLTQKTNQFNMTTIRYSEGELSALIERGDGDAFVLRARDRFGDNGIVGVAILRTAGTATEIDTLLLSCRVIGRTVETAFLSYLSSHARSTGARKLRGRYLPTKKNGPAKDVYPSHGFVRTEDAPEHVTWEFDLDTPIAWPPWIRQISLGDLR
jgi:FkbH-like protein